jgi:hypothetical protein
VILGKEESLFSEKMEHCFEDMHIDNNQNMKSKL